MALADVDRAQQFAAAGDTLKALSELEKGPFAPIDRDRGYRLLVALETTSGEGGKAMRDATLAAQEVPGLAADPTFVGSLVPLASGAQGATLLDFLLAHPTSASMDALYKISLMPTGTANSAWKLLSAGSLEPSMSAPLRIAVFLRKMGPSCKVKETVIEAAAQGDGRSLPFLERLLPSRSASAPLLKRIFGGGKRDPLACLHATTIVQDAITQIKARGQ
jgi:hypothetical protein